MRILVYGLNYAPELTGIGKYSGEMCEWLVQRGHEVKVVCAPPYYPAWKVADGYDSLKYFREELNGVTVQRCPLWLPVRQSGIRRILHLISFATSSLPVVIGTSLIWRPDVVFVLEPPFLCTPAALAAARLSGAKSWLHIQDLELDAAFALGLVKSSLLKNIASRVERFIMRRFDRVSTISQSMLACIRRKGVLSDRIYLFSNWVNTQSIYPILGQSRFRDEWAVENDSIVVLYSGNMGEKQGLEIVVEAARLLAHHKNILFILSGDGSACKKLENLANGLDNIRFRPLQPLEQLNDLLNLADIHVLPQRQDVASLVMPSKLLGMMASGRPVIATAESSSELGLLVNKCGIVVHPGNPLALSEAIANLASDPSLRDRMGNSARSLCIENWDRDRVLEHFEFSLNEMCNRIY